MPILCPESVAEGADAVVEEGQFDAGIELPGEVVEGMDKGQSILRLRVVIELVVALAELLGKGYTCEL